MSAGNLEYRYMKTLFVKEAISVCTKRHLTTADIDVYFGDNYQHFVDGDVLNKTLFIKHLNTLNSVISKIEIEFEHIIEQKNQVAAVFLFKVRKKNKHKSTTRIIAIFDFKNNKISSCHESTELIDGDQSDNDLQRRI